MALLFFDGFDHFGTGGSVVSTGKWATGASALASTTQKRTGTHSLVLNNSSASATTKPFVVSGGAVIGFGFYYAVASSALDILQIMEAAIVHVALGVDATGHLVIKRGATVLATGATALSINNWYYLEVKAVIDDASGAYEVHIDEVAEAALTVTGADTRNAGTGVWDRIRVVGLASGHYVDDLYVCDTSGSAPRNTFLGPVKVDTLYPQPDATAAGSNAGLTPSTGTDHGALVDETTPNTTDYNSSPTVGVKDTYNYPAMALAGLVLGVQTNLYCQKSDAAVRQVCSVVRVGSTDYDGANVAPLTTWSYLSTVHPVNPATAAAWTVADVATLEAGMKVTV